MFRFALFACVSAGSLMAMGLLPAPKPDILPNISVSGVQVPDQPALMASLAGFSFNLPNVTRFEDSETLRPKPRPVMSNSAYPIMTVPDEARVTTASAVLKPVELSEVPLQQPARSERVPQTPITSLVQKVTALVQPARDRPPQIVASTVNFDFDNSDLDGQAITLLSAFAAQVRANPDVEIGIIGHTDRVGTEDYNDALGMRRAKRVASYLLAAGVPRNTIKVIESHGERFPAVETDGKSRANRRVLAEVWN